MKNFLPGFFLLASFHFIYYLFCYLEMMNSAKGFMLLVVIYVLSVLIGLVFNSIKTGDM